jgi:hypothetical protein
MKLLRFLWAIKSELLKIWAFFFILTVLTGDISRIGWLNITLIASAYTGCIILIIAVYHYYFKANEEENDGNI